MELKKEQLEQILDTPDVPAPKPQDTFILKTVLRDENEKVIGIVAWDNGKKSFFSLSSFDPEKKNQIRWVPVRVRMKSDSKTMNGKVNIGTFDRLSDYLNGGPEFIPFSDTTNNGVKGEFTILSKSDISHISPTKE